MANRAPGAADRSADHSEPDEGAIVRDDQTYHEDDTGREERTDDRSEDVLRIEDPPREVGLGDCLLYTSDAADD